MTAVFILTVFEGDNEDAIPELLDVAFRFGLDVEGESRFFNKENNK